MSEPRYNHLGDPQDWRAILLAAADLLDEPGAWTGKGRKLKAEGPWCAVTAMRYVTPPPVIDIGELARAKHHLAQHVARHPVKLHAAGLVVATWNDSQRERRPVVAGMRKAALA